MKTVRLHFFKWYFAVPLASFLLLASCSTPGEEAVTPSLSSYSGIELFEGLLFAKGKAAEQFPELESQLIARASLSGEIVDDLTELETSIVEVLKAKNPAYFDEFKQAITSGKHFEIQRALYGGQELLVQTSYELSGRQAPDMASLRSMAESFSDEFDVKKVMAEDGTIDLEKLETLKVQNQAFNTRTNMGEQACLAIAIAVVAVAVYAWTYLWPKAISSDELGLGQEGLHLKGEQLIQSIVEASA